MVSFMNKKSLIGGPSEVFYTASIAHIEAPIPEYNLEIRLTDFFPVILSVFDVFSLYLVKLIACFLFGWSTFSEEEVWYRVISTRTLLYLCLVNYYSACISACMLSVQATDFVPGFGLTGYITLLYTRKKRRRKTAFVSTTCQANTKTHTQKASQPTSRD